MNLCRRSNTEKRRPILFKYHTKFNKKKTPSQSFEMEHLEIKHFGVIKCAV